MDVTVLGIVFMVAVLVVVVIAAVAVVAVMRGIILLVRSSIAPPGPAAPVDPDHPRG